MRNLNSTWRNCVITDKEQLKNLIVLNSNYKKEIFLKKNYPIFYSQLQSIQFPNNFTYQQKLYHYLNDDYELKIGICPECGNRCKFKSINIGYTIYCSQNCQRKSKTTVDKRKQSYFNKTDEEKEQIRLKRKSSCLKTYGVDNPSQSSEIKEKKKQTCLKKYGKEYYTQTVEYKEKYTNTCLKKYGKEYYTQTEEYLEKSKHTRLDRYNDENYNNRTKAKSTCFEKYGVKYPAQSAEIKEKMKDTCIERYGKESFTQTPLFLIKQYQTKKKNNSFNASKIETSLKEYFTNNNINFIYQYKSEQYQFYCDFYFPEKDLYVEIQGSWTHGTHPFTGSESDIELLEKWKSKNSTYYNNAIETWTIRDVVKRETAKINKLNYLEIFSTNLDECIRIISEFYLRNNCL